jgi:hypothetical protein
MSKWVMLPKDWSHAHARDVWVNLDKVDYIEFWTADDENHVGLYGAGIATGRSSDPAFVREVQGHVEGPDAKP